MKLVRWSLLFVVMLLVGSLLVACGGSATEAPASEPQPENVQETAPAEAEAEEPEEAAAATEADQPAEPEMPVDVPIMAENRDFQATADFTNISFIVDLEIADVVAWYQAELPAYGWELSRAPDSALGSMANMSRINAENDRLTISLQYNPVGFFSVVRIVVVRSP